jgi:hypothetical protein
MTQNRAAADNIAIDITKLKLELFRGNDQDALDIKTWCIFFTIPPFLGGQIFSCDDHYSLYQY